MAGSKDPANENEPGREISPREIAVLIRCMAGNFPEIDAPYRMALLRKLVKAERRAGFVSAVEVVPAEALREAKAAHEKADAENRMLRAFIDRGEYQEDVAALLTVNRCSYCGDLVGSDPTLCGPCGDEADMERDEALEAAREAQAEAARLREALQRLSWAWR